MCQEYSHDGNIHMHIKDKAMNFTAWMYEQIKPYLKGDILEIGSGIGTYSKEVIRDFKESDIILSEIDSSYINILQERFKKNQNVNVKYLDLNNKEHFDKIEKKFDSVFALNVLEHVEDDHFALNLIYSILKDKGRLILLVPAHKFLYTCHDEAVGHYRRYTKKELSQKGLRTGFKITKTFYFNFVSIFGWYINGKLLKKKTYSEGTMGLFDKLVPFFRIFEKYFLFKKAGISLIAILEKDADQ